MPRRWELARSGERRRDPQSDASAAAACAAREHQPAADDNDSLPGEFRFVPDGSGDCCGAHESSRNPRSKASPSRRGDVGPGVVVHCGSSLPDCSATIYAAHQSGQFASRCLVRFSCSPRTLEWAEVDWPGSFDPQTGELSCPVLEHGTGCRNGKKRRETERREKNRKPKTMAVKQRSSRRRQ